MENDVKKLEDEISYLSEELQRERMRSRPARLMQIILLIGTIVSAIIGLAIMFTVVWISLIGVYSKTPVVIPEILANWGGIILGFYFGTVFGLAKDYIQLSKD